MVYWGQSAIFACQILISRLTCRYARVIQNSCGLDDATIREHLVMAMSHKNERALLILLVSASLVFAMLLANWGQSLLYLLTETGGKK